MINLSVTHIIFTIDKLGHRTVWWDLSQVTFIVLKHDHAMEKTTRDWINNELILAFIFCKSVHMFQCLKLIELHYNIFARFDY